jgi:hypothetical protein
MTDELSQSGSELPAVEVDDRPQIAASERDLLLFARALVSPDVEPWSTPRQSRKLPSHIGPTAARLIGEALSHAWLALWRRGGSAPGASLDPGGESIRRGRVWQRHPPAPLTFTGASIALLRWLVAMAPTSSQDTRPTLPATPLSLGDEVVLYLALDAARDSWVQAALAAQPLAVGSALAWLGFAHAIPATARPPAFAHLCTGAGAIVVEAITPELAARWRSIELVKRGVAAQSGWYPSIDNLLALGNTQAAALTAFMDACDAAHRRDLALFVVDAIAPLLARDLAPIPPPLDPTAPLSARGAARTAAGTLVRALVRWRTWDAEHRAIRFVDDGYQAAQLLLARYEVIGTAGGDRADAWLAELSRMTPSATVTDPREPA